MHGKQGYDRLWDSTGIQRKREPIDGSTMFHSTKQPPFFSIPMLYRVWIQIIRLQKNDVLHLVVLSLDGCWQFAILTGPVRFELSVHAVWLEAKGNSMKKDKEDMRKSYKRSDFLTLERGKFYAEVAKGTSVVLLEPAIAKAFPTSQAVNEALSELLALTEKTARMTRRSTKTRAKVENTD